MNLESRWETTGYTLEEYEPVVIITNEDTLNGYSVWFKEIVRKEQKKLKFELLRVEDRKLLTERSSSFFNESLTRSLVGNQTHGCYIEQELYPNCFISVVGWVKRSPLEDMYVILHEIGHAHNTKSTKWEREIEASQWALATILIWCPTLYTEALCFLAGCLETYLESFPEELQPYPSEYYKFEQYCREVLDVRRK